MRKTLNFSTRKLSGLPGDEGLTIGLRRIFDLLAALAGLVLSALIR